MTPPRPPVDPEPWLLPEPAAPLDWIAIFGNDHPVELEVGPGKGLFLANAAVQRPGHNFLGVEIARKYARKAAERAAKLGLENVRVMAADARKLFAEFLPAASLEAIHVYFPDPWWKKRHKKRRVFSESFVGDALRVLHPGGLLSIATDVEEYFGVMQDLLATRPELEGLPPPQPGEPRHDLDYLTNFERKYRIEGRPIWRAQYRRKEVRGEPGAGPDASA